MRRALVTGATGHIGNHVVRTLLDHGWTVGVYVRPGSDRRALAGLDVEVHEGDLLDPDALTRAAQGVDVLFHVGAAHRNWAADPADIVRPAVEGTRNALAAAVAAGVERVVYTSSGATVGFADDPARPLDESAFLDHAASPYTQGKIAAERLVLEHARAHARPEIVVLNPSGVFGPRDLRLTPATRGLVGLAQGDPAFFAVCVTDVRDVAEAHRLAADRGRHGERYLVVGELGTPTQVAAWIGQITGKPPAVFLPPRFLLGLLARLAVWKARRSGEDAAVTPELVADVHGRHLAYDGRRAREELGVSYRPATEVLRDAYRWLLHVDALKPAVAARVRATLGAAAAPDPGW